MNCIGYGQDHPKNVPCPDGTVWWTQSVKCRICNYQWVAIVPIKLIDPDPDNLECSNCGNYTGSPVEMKL